MHVNRHGGVCLERPLKGNVGWEKVNRLNQIEAR